MNMSNENLKCLLRTMEMLFDEYMENNKILFKDHLIFGNSIKSHIEIITEENKTILNSLEILRHLSFSKNSGGKTIKELNEFSGKLKDYIDNYG